MTDQNTQTPPQAPVPPPASTSVDNDKLMGILSYLGILILIPLLITKNRSAGLTVHLNQGLNLIIVALIGSIVIPLVHLWFLSPIWNLLMLVLVVVGIVNVVRSEAKPLPVIGNWFHLIK